MGLTDPGMEYYEAISDSPEEAKLLKMRQDILRAEKEG